MDIGLSDWSKIRCHGTVATARCRELLPLRHSPVEKRWLSSAFEAQTNIRDRPGSGRSRLISRVFLVSFRQRHVNTRVCDIKGLVISHLRKARVNRQSCSDRAGRSRLASYPDEYRVHFDIAACTAIPDAGCLLSEVCGCDFLLPGLQIRSRFSGRAWDYIKVQPYR